MFSREIEDGINFFSCRSLSQWAKTCSYLSKKKKKKKKRKDHVIVRSHVIVLTLNMFLSNGLVY